MALRRKAGHARDADVVVGWVHAELAEGVVPPASFDLVSAQYPAPLRTSDATAERALLAAVAPGGVLLLVLHMLPLSAWLGDHPLPVARGKVRSEPLPVASWQRDHNSRKADRWR